MANTFGHLFRITTWGESHGGGVGVVVDGCPPRLPLTEADIQPDLDRRRPGQSKIVSPLPGPRPVDHLAGLWSLSSSASATSAAATPAPQEHARLVDLALLNY